MPNPEIDLTKLSLQELDILAFEARQEREKRRCYSKIAGEGTKEIWCNKERHLTGNHVGWGTQQLHDGRIGEGPMEWVNFEELESKAESKTE